MVINMNKKTILIFIFLFIISLVLQSCNSGADIEDLDFVADCEYDTTLTVSELCSLQETVTVAFIGGSITHSDAYRSYVMEYLINAYPDNEFVEVRAGIGGTTSAFGVGRIDKHVIEYDPDIVFIEFSVNDGSDDDLYKESMEGMIRKVLGNKENTLLTVIGTATAVTMPSYKNGEDPAGVRGHKEVAAYYNVPYINVGKVLYQHIVDTETDVLEYLPDNVHPNYVGGKIYADEIIRWLQDYEWNIDFKEQPLTANSYENAYMHWASEFANDQWTVSLGGGNIYDDHLVPNYIESKGVGSTLEFDFYGTFFGAFYTLEDDSGIIEYSIDGGEWQKFSLWDIYCLDSDRCGGSIIVNGLENKEHHMVIRVSAEKDDRSNGNKVNFSAFYWGHK